MFDFKWTGAEKKAAYAAFNLAYERESQSVLQMLKQKMQALTSLDQLPRLVREMNGLQEHLSLRYDYRYSRLILVFAGLRAEGWLEAEELSGLSADKRQRIEEIARFNRD